MAKELKHVKIDDLINSGLLQEVNRQFFHPRGLALAVAYHTGDDEHLNETEVAHMTLIDSRDDPEGFMFADGVLSEEKAESCANLLDSFKEHREQHLGFVIQPI